jgi:L-fucose isomerase-like protein
MMSLQNTPDVKLGIVGVSRDCFPASLTRTRLGNLMKEVDKTSLDAYACETIIENENDAYAAGKELHDQGCNALVVYLGNFGPEGPTTTLMQRFHGPSMVCAAAEENKDVLASDRGDALCGLLNNSYNQKLKGLKSYIPQYPVGLPGELVSEIAAFENIARVIIGLKSLRVLSFGPRPQDFFACNAPIQPLYDLGIEVMENSELDLYQIFQEAAGKTNEINAVVEDMKKELGEGCTYPDLLPKLAQFEVALLDFMENNIGSRKYAVFADKCWPAFESSFGFVPCYVNSRLAGRGIPVACEVDIYGAISEFMVQLASMHPATLLDINNSVPSDLIPNGFDLKGADQRDLFMGFHCGNTACSCLKDCCMKYQLIMNRLMEDGNDPDITRGTIEGQLKPGETTLFRLQSTSDCQLRSYIAEGHLLDVDPCTFGGTGIFAIPGFARFYRHVMVGKNFPHHGATAFKKVGKTMYEVVKMLGVEDVGVPLPDSMLYDGENPFELFG